jgi:ribosomal protein S18 acetylase RimI-like enzyme
MNNLDFAIRPFMLSDEEAVIGVWKASGLTHPNNDPHKDIARKMKVNPELFLVGELDGQIVGTVMAGYEGHRGWINYLGVTPEQQGKGLGEALMVEAERLLRERGCPKINLQVRTTNTKVIAFYQKIGFAIDQTVSLGKRLEPDNQ